MRKEMRVYEDLLLENTRLHEQAAQLRNATQEICDKYVSPPFYAAAMDLVDKIYGKKE